MAFDSDFTANGHSKYRVVHELLSEYGAMVGDALSAYLPSKEPRRYLYELVAEYPSRGGKMMRPALCIAAARAFGAPVKHALRTAVAIELLHNALLIHDDIEDESEERRSLPTLHMMHGVPLAINAGDTMTLMSLRPLIENADILGLRLTMRIIEDMERMARESAEGQAIDIGWRRDNVIDLNVDDYLAMVLKKTCWLATIYPIRVGAMIGMGSDRDLDRFLFFGFLLGAAFQIQDDLLNLVGDHTYGKELNGDLLEGKRTLMLIRLFERATPDEHQRLSSILSLKREERLPEHVCWMRTLMDSYGCLDYAKKIANGLADAAHDEYSMLFSHLPDSRDKRFLGKMITWVIERH
jgi:geranylgeranyl diphosphate synthase, type II